jgi:hypothetical protein
MQENLVSIGPVTSNFVKGIGNEKVKNCVIQLVRIVIRQQTNLFH